MIEGRHLTKILGSENQEDQILKNISLTVGKGEFVGIMGPSGAGKTTLLKILSTLMKPTAGEVVLDEKKIADFSENDIADFRQEKIGYIFQDFLLVETLNVFDNLAVPLVIQGKTRQEIKEKVEQISADFHLTSILASFPKEISIGQRQLVATARAFIHQPAMVFADEPTGSLDSKNATHLLKDLVRRNQEENTTILMVTHDPFSASFCHRILFIKDGQIFAEMIKRQDRQDFLKKIIQMQEALAGRLDSEYSSF